MRYWVFNEEMLDSALAAHEAARQRAGASAEQAKDETVAIKTFLYGAAPLQAGGGGLVECR